MPILAPVSSPMMRTPVRFKMLLACAISHGPLNL